jgi:hypothetical protein
MRHIQRQAFKRFGDPNEVPGFGFSITPSFHYSITPGNDSFTDFSRLSPTPLYPGDLGTKFRSHTGF